MAAQALSDDIELTRLRPPTTGREVGYGKRLLAGGTAGGMGISVLNPMEVIKTQLQASGPAKTSAAEIFKRVLRTDGVLGFWAGGAMPIARRATYHPVLLSAVCAPLSCRAKSRHWPKHRPHLPGVCGGAWNLRRGQNTAVVTECARRWARGPLVRQLCRCVCVRGHRHARGCCQNTPHESGWRTSRQCLLAGIRVC